MVSGSEVASDLTILREPLREADGEQVLIGLRSALAWLEVTTRRASRLLGWTQRSGSLR